MSTQNDGGPAFPYQRIYTEGVIETPRQVSGMSLRDYFAAKAMPFVAERAELDHTGPEEWAAACYEIADEMLEAREK